MSLKLLASSVAIFVLAGCASVSMESKDKSDIAKKFNNPSVGSAGLYIYRFGSLGAALKKDIWVDGKCTKRSGISYHIWRNMHQQRLDGHWRA